MFESVGADSLSPRARRGAARKREACIRSYVLQVFIVELEPYHVKQFVKMARRVFHQTCVSGRVVFHQTCSITHDATADNMWFLADFILTFLGHMQ